MKTRHRTTWCTVAVLCGATIGLAGCSPAAPFIAPSPAGGFSIRSCPPALGALRDVTPPARRTDGLLDARPSPAAALVCEYGGVFDQGHGPRHALTRQLELRTAPAEQLADAIARIDVGAPAAASSGCPDDSGEVTVIVFGYRSSPPVDLWWHSSGCQTIDDGAVRAEQVANASFGRFQAVFAAVARATA